MKPDWDKLMGEYEGNDKTLVGDVDCTAEGKPLCDANGVKGFPTIKHGDPAALDDYEGGRDLSSLQKFAAGLKPLCSPKNLDLCDDEQKAEIAKIQAMSTEELDAAIKDAEDKSAAAEKLFKDEVEKLQATYQQLQKDKDATLAEIKEAGLGLLKSVRAAKASGSASGHDEL
jgi:hypothetical protein